MNHMAQGTADGRGVGGGNSREAVSEFAGRSRHAGNVNNMNVAGEERTDEMEGTEEDGGRGVMGNMAAVPAVHSSSVVDLEDDMAASQEMRYGEEREDHGNDLQGGGFAAIGSPTSITSSEEERCRPGEAGAENNSTRVVHPDGSAATVAVATVWDPTAGNTCETGSSGIGDEGNGGQGRADRTGWDGESITGGEDGRGEHPEVKEDLWGRDQEDLFIELKAGDKLVEWEPECAKERAHLTDIVELPSEGLCVLERDGACKQGDTESLSGGGELLRGEAPCEGVSEEADAQDSSDCAVEERLLEVWAGWGEADANGGTEGLIGCGKQGAIGGVRRGNDRGIIECSVYVGKKDARHHDRENEEGGTESVESRNRCSGAENQLGLNEVHAKPAETLEPEIRAAGRYIFVGIA